MTSAKKDIRRASPTTPKKQLQRGMSLYRFVESSRTLRSTTAAKGDSTPKTDKYFSPVKQTKEKTATVSKTQNLPILASSKKISKKPKRTTTDIRKQTRSAGQRNISDFLSVKKQQPGDSQSSRRVGFKTPTKGKTFKQTRLAIQGKKMKIYATAADDYTDISAATAATAKRGRPFGSKNKNVKAVTRKAKTEANSVIKQLYSSPRKGSIGRSP